MSDFENDWSDGAEAELNGGGRRRRGRREGSPPQEQQQQQPQFTPVAYTPTDQELAYLRESLGTLVEDEWFTDILFKVKGGKEATVYCCAAHPSTGMELVAAKVYRPRQFRAMRNDGFYRIGRTLINAETGKLDYRGRAARALKKRTDFGRQVEMSSWNQYEFQLLNLLYEAGADVPRPLAHGHNCILMEFLGDRDGGAPVLQSVSLDAGEARPVFERLMWNVELMLSKYLIHADLSPHNVMWHAGRAWVIDLPQAVVADEHPAAYSLLSRDVDRLCRYFAKHGVDCDSQQIAHDLWARLLRQEL